MGLFEELSEVFGHSLEGMIEERLDPQEEEEIRAALRNPDCMPNEQLDKTVEFWLKRLAWWGKLNITHYDPELNRKFKLTADELLEILSNQELIDIFGNWEKRKLTVKSLELYRIYRDERGRMKRESIVIDIDLEPELKRSLKGRY